MLKQILYADKEGNQPFLIAGSGTMGWDQVAMNLLEQGDEAVRPRLCLHRPRQRHDPLLLLRCRFLRVRRTFF